MKYSSQQPMKYLTQGKDGDQEAVAELRLHLRHAGEPDQRGIQRAAAAGAQGQQRGHQRRNARLVQTDFCLFGKKLPSVIIAPARDSVRYNFILISN